MRARPLALAAAALVAVGVARAQAPVAPANGAIAADSLAGCYRLEHAPWPSGLDHPPNPARLPARLELTAEPFRVRVRHADGTTGYADEPRLRGARRVRHAGLPDGAGAFSYWQASESGTVHLARYPRFAGFGLAVRPSADGLEGELASSTDFVQPDRPTKARVAARLVREPCPTP